MPFWAKECFRSANDLDFASLTSFAPEKTFAVLCSALTSEDGEGGKPKETSIEFIVQDASWEVIFEQTDFPGIRVEIPVVKNGIPTDSLQIDVGFNDPIPFGPLERSIETTGSQNRPGDRPTILIPRPETAFGWKLHGIVEREGFSWRAKDIGDLWLIATKVELDVEKMKESILISFSSRDAPLWRLDRLLFGKFGLSNESKRGWRRHRREHPEVNFPEDHLVCLETVRKSVMNVLPEHRSNSMPTWPVNLRRVEFESIVNQSKQFKLFPWTENETETGTVFVCQRADKTTCPDPIRAETETEFRIRQIKREARGVTFGRQGELLARPYANFESFEGLQRLSDADLAALRLTVVEKLDGSMIFPTPTGKGWCLRTRRGRSSIAEAAQSFAENSNGDYAGLIEYCFTKHWTPIFEWCSRSRRIVFDHPVDRLVLTGIREIESGILLEDKPLRQLGTQFNIEVADRVEFNDNLEELESRVSAWTTREGCILRDCNGRQYKLKSKRYLWLHRLVEGTGRMRACWKLLADGAKDQLLEVCSGRDKPADRYVLEIECTIARVLNIAETKAARFRNLKGNARRMLAKEIENDPSQIRTLTFAAFEHQNIEAIMMQMIQQACHNEQTFQSLVTSFEGPIVNEAN